MEADDRRPIGSGKAGAATTSRFRAWRGLAAAALLPAAGCLDSGGPLFPAKDDSLRPALATLHTVASTGPAGDSIPSRAIAAENLMAGLVWAQINDTLYHQAVRANREWPLRLDAPLVSVPPPEALLNVGGNGGSRFGASILFLFEDADGNGRYDPPGPGAAGGPHPRGDWLMAVAGETRILYISDPGALEWVRAHPPRDAFLTVDDPSRLGVGFNLLSATGVRDTVFREYRIHYPGGGTGLSDSPPDSGEYEVLSHPRKICDGFTPVDWSREIPLDFGDPAARLVMVAPRPADRP